MPATTPIYAWPYQELGDPPHGPDLGQDLAEAVETTVDGIDTRLTTAEGDIDTLEARGPGPFAMEIGTATVSISGDTVGSQAVTFEADLFSVAPRVFVLGGDTTSARAYNLASSDTSATGFTIQARHIDATSTTTSFSVQWMAIQAASGSADGPLGG